MEKGEHLCGCFCSDGLLGEEEIKMGICEMSEKDLSENHRSFYSESNADGLVLSEEVRNNSLKDKKPGLKREKPIIVEDDHGGELDLIRREFMHHERGICRINNGSFGSCPASVLDSQAKWARLFLQQPDSFCSGPLQEGLLQSRKIVAELINAAHVDEVSLVDNATTAAAIVLQQVAWAFMENSFQKGDVILMLHYAYGSVKKSIQAYAGRAGACIIEVELPFPVQSNEEIMEKFKAAVERGKRGGGKIRLAVIDHVSSMPSVLFPVKELTAICREEGVDQVFIDGAHGIGNLNIDMQEIGADFYASNLYKWFFCPASVAFLYCRRTFHSILHHPIVTHEFENGLPAESAWIGTRDYSAQLCVPSVLEFTKKFEGGIEAIMKRNHEKVVAMGEMLAEAWGTELGTSPELCSSMVMVALPNCLEVSSDQDALKLRSRLRKEFSVEVPIYYRAPKTELHSNRGPSFKAYARIAHQMYNTVDEYLTFKAAILQIVAEASEAKEQDCPSKREWPEFEKSSDSNIAIPQEIAQYEVDELIDKFQLYWRTFFISF